MILVDYREGSKDLIKPLQKRGLPVTEADLDAGDLAFVGRGEGGTPVSIGIEHKKVADLVQSIRTERLQGHQLGKMRAEYFMSYLFIEGELLYDERGRLLRRSRHGRPKVMPGSMGIGELLKRVYVLQLCGGLHPWWSATQRDTVLALEMLYRVWTDTDLDKHKSHIAVYQPPPPVPISQLRQTLCSLPGVKVAVSKAAEQTFGSIRAAVNAPVKAWAALETRDARGQTRRFGERHAQTVVNALTHQFRGSRART